VVEQKRIEEDYFFIITVDGEQLHSVQNKKGVRRYENVKVYAANPWNASANGYIRNLKINQGTQSCELALVSSAPMNTSNTTSDENSSTTLIGTKGTRGTSPTTHISPSIFTPSPDVQLRRRHSENLLHLNYFHQSQAYRWRDLLRPRSLSVSASNDLRWEGEEAEGYNKPAAAFIHNGSGRTSDGISDDKRRDSGDPCTTIIPYIKCVKPSGDRVCPDKPKGQLDNELRAIQMRSLLFPLAEGLWLREVENLDWRLVSSFLFVIARSIDSSNDEVMEIAENTLANVENGFAKVPPPKSFHYLLLKKTNPMEAAKMLMENIKSDAVHEVFGLPFPKLLVDFCEKYKLDQDLLPRTHECRCKNNSIKGTGYAKLDKSTSTLYAIDTALDLLEQSQKDQEKLPPSDYDIVVEMWKFLKLKTLELVSQNALERSRWLAFRVMVTAKKESMCEIKTRRAKDEEEEDGSGAKDINEIPEEVNEMCDDLYNELFERQNPVTQVPGYIIDLIGKENALMYLDRRLRDTGCIKSVRPICIYDLQNGSHSCSSYNKEYHEACEKFFAHPQVFSATVNTKTLLGHDSGFKLHPFFGLGIHAPIEAQKTCNFFQRQCRNSYCRLTHFVSEADFIAPITSLPPMQNVDRKRKRIWDERFIKELQAQFSHETRNGRLCPHNFGLVFFKDKKAEKGLTQLLAVVKAFDFKNTKWSPDDKSTYTLLLKHLLLACYRYPEPQLIQDFNTFWAPKRNVDVFQEASTWVDRELRTASGDADHQHEHQWLDASNGWSHNENQNTTNPTSPRLNGNHGNNGGNSVWEKPKFQWGQSSESGQGGDKPKFQWGQSSESGQGGDKQNRQKSYY